jgi:hypothetical protein
MNHLNPLLTISYSHYGLLNLISLVQFIIAHTSYTASRLDSSFTDLMRNKLNNFTPEVNIKQASNVDLIERRRRT